MVRLAASTESALEYKGFDFKNPNYAAVFGQRLRFLEEIRKQPSCIPELKAYYRENPADFINDWGVTFDPRNADRKLPTLIPFVLFPRQREWVDWVIGHWRARTPGLCEKSRDMGISWLAMSLSCTLCLFNDGMAIGCGSRKEDLVDKIGTMKPLLPKARTFMTNLPAEFRGGWMPYRDAPFMRVNFPETGSLIVGETGDEIGRGDRAGLYFIDESAHLERPDLVEMSLSQTTNTRIDMSSVNGMNNPFAKKRHEGKVDVFIFDWRDDPRKDDKWYRLLSAPKEEGGQGLDPVTIAQEVDRDYSASVEGIVIPGVWVRSAIDALETLGLVPSGSRGLALDVADEGVDMNATCANHGVLITHIDEWSGKGADIFATTQRAFSTCDELGLDGFRYDTDGLGAGVRGDARVINETRQAAGAKRLAATGFRGSDAVLDPEGIVDGTIGSDGDKGRTNQDYFANRKAQAWWSLRNRFRKTHRWVEAVKEARKNGTSIAPGAACSPDEIISIPSKLALCMKLVAELSQPTYSVNGAGKIVINKKPNGMKSPNLGDVVMIKFAEIERQPMQITPDLIAQVQRAGRRRPY